MNLKRICKISCTIVEVVVLEFKLVEIISSQKIKFFSIEQANDILPLVYRITEDYSKKVKYLMACVEAIPDKKSARSLEFQDEINALVQKWQSKIERLGLKPKGLWMIDFDYGDGYFCWKFPETKIMYAHGYKDGFSGRRLVNKDV